MEQNEQNNCTKEQITTGRGSRSRGDRKEHCKPLRCLTVLSERKNLVLVQSFLVDSCYIHTCAGPLEDPDKLCTGHLCPSPSHALCGSIHPSTQSPRDAVDIVFGMEVTNVQGDVENRPSLMLRPPVPREP